MINNIINGISNSLYEEFGENYEIYKESVEQGLQEPCFSIVILDNSSTRGLDNRYLREYNFDIHYFPLEKVNIKEEIYNVSERLLLCLKTINTIDFLLNGINIHYEIVDNILHFFITYKLFVKECKEQSTNMEKIDIKTGVKNG